MVLPEKYVTKMKDLLGEDFGRYMMSFQEERHYGLRANTLKIPADALSDKLSIAYDPVPWCADGMYYHQNLRPAKSPYYHAGLFYIQEPSAMSAASVLDVRTGDKVLDLCAAPGGKSTQIAAKLCGKGTLVANDVSATRCRALVRNLELCGVTNAVVVNEPPEKLAPRFEHFFDKIIIDAPCSGEGMFRKDPDAVKSWAEYKPQACTAMQRPILAHGARMLKPGGRMVYSTCTFEPDENEAMIDWFLRNHPEFDIVPLNHAALGLDTGRPEWGGGRKELAGCGRLWPHKARGEGHFLCLLEKKGEGSQLTDEKPERLPPYNGKVEKIDGIEYFETFCEKALVGDKIGRYSFQAEKLLKRGMALYSPPAGLPDLRGIRVARSGWYLGDIKTKRFEPSQALAMGIRQEEAAQPLSFAIGSDEVLRYLKGESFPVEGPEGWTLVCAEQFPLGWGKVQNGRLKNKYIKGWIMD